ncbi:MAG: TonB-dependent receptor plug domain-containing protein [Saprospiraceae bacterium]
MKKSILLAFLFGFSVSLFSQILTISDKNTNEPIANVKLVCEYPNITLTSDSNGKVDISALKGATDIEFISDGYRFMVFNYDDIVINNFRVQLSPINIKLEDIVISATKTGKISTEIPTKIDKITPEEIQLFNPQTSADLLTISGNVFIQKSQQGGGSPMIRGFATNRLLYSVDGVRMNTAIFRGGNIQNVISLDPFSFENVEILFGPGSVIYGSDAIGGVMSFTTLKPVFSESDNPKISGKSIARYSSANNEKTGHFDVNVGWKKWSFVSSLSSFDFGDLKMGSYGPEEYLRPIYVERIDGYDVAVQNSDPKVQVPSGYSQVNMMQKVSFKPSDKWQFDYGIHYSETSDYSRYDRQLRYKNGLAGMENGAMAQKWLMNNFKRNENNQSNLLFSKATLNLAYQYFEESRIN